MKRISFLTILAMAALALVLVAGCGGSDGDSGGSTNSELVGKWTMVSTKGTTCSNCVMLTFEVNGTGTYTDRTGDWLGAKTSVSITWSASGGILRFSGAGIDATVAYTYAAGDPDQLVLKWDDGNDVYLRVNMAPN